MQPGQCRGTTTKGIRCKIVVKEGYCHYHIKQSLSEQNEYRAKSSNMDRDGFIYMYTLSRLLTRKKESKLKVKNVVDKSGKNSDKWKTFNQRSPYTLVKIGMTSQSVEQRLRQWEDKCHHKLSSLCPNNDATMSIKFDGNPLGRMLSRFTKLSISPKIYKSFKQDGKGFYCEKNLRLVESKIHACLRERYGFGDVLCSGCASKNGSDHSEKTRSGNGDPSKKTHNVHIEWFYVPKKDIDSIFDVIDSVCLKYNNY